MSERSEIVRGILADLAAGGSLEEGFRRLIEIYHHPLLRFFSRRGLSPEDCHDLTQETFLGIYRGIGSFRSEAGFDTWLFTIATNACRKRHRWGAAEKRKAEEVPWEEETENAAPAAGAVRAPPTPADEALRRERATLLWEAVESLPEQMRKCLVLKVYQERKVGEIGTLLRISTETVKAHLYQARRRLRQCLGEGATARDAGEVR